MRIADLLKMYRAWKQMPVRSVAAEIGINHSTLIRLEQGQPMNGKTLLKVMAWLFGEVEK